MSTPTRADEIVTAVREVMDGLIPSAAGRAGFDARVASRLLALLQRELEQGEAARAAEHAGLCTLLPVEDADDISTEALRVQLCKHIAHAAPALNTPGLFEHLWRTALAQLAIDSPAYRYADCAGSSVP